MKSLSWWQTLARKTNVDQQQQEYTSPETQERDSENNTQAITVVDEQYEMINNETPEQSKGVMENNNDNTEDIMEVEHNSEGYVSLVAISMISEVNLSARYMTETEEPIDQRVAQPKTKADKEGTICIRIVQKPTCVINTKDTRTYNSNTTQHKGWNECLW